MDSRLCEDCVKYPYSGNIGMKVGRETTTPYRPALLDLMMGHPGYIDLFYN